MVYDDLETTCFKAIRESGILDQMVRINKQDFIRILRS